MIVAIQPDYDDGPGDSSSPIWRRVLEGAGHQVKEVNVFRADILEQLKGCDGFMWRHHHMPFNRQIAKRLLPVIENELGLVIYPDQKTCWHYDDKIAQSYLLKAAGIPIPKTWLWFDRALALDWAKTAVYPLVLKLWAGAGSTNVRLITSYEEAARWICRLFEIGVADLSDSKSSLRQRFRDARALLSRGELATPWELHKNYVLFQEFLSGNGFDTRISVIGNRAFGFRRFNRENDFRASGSGKLDYNPAEINLDFVRLAFDVSNKLGTQSCAIDGLLRGKESVVGEITYTYTSWAVQACPGHWDSSMSWHQGQMWPEEAQAADFIKRLIVSGK